METHINNNSLFDACKENSIDQVKLLLEKGTDVNIKDDYGHTVLHIASYHNNIEIVKLLENANK